MHRRIHRRASYSQLDPDRVLLSLHYLFSLRADYLGDEREHKASTALFREELVSYVVVELLAIGEVLFSGGKSDF